MYSTALVELDRMGEDAKKYDTQSKRRIFTKKRGMNKMIG